MNAIMRILMGEEIEEEEKENLRLERIFLRDRSNPFDLPRAEFKRLFRLTKELMRQLIEEITPYVDEGQRETKIPVLLRVLSTVYFLATGHYQRSIGSNFNIAIAQQTVSKYLPEICNAIEAIAPRWIQFPIDEETKQRIKEEFMRKFRFPGIIGVIDGTQIRISEPEEDEHIYFNRKGYHAKNVQIICDSNLNILNVNANFGGATHDSFIWNTSMIRTVLVENYELGDKRSWLIGDSGYPLEPWLITPIRNTREGTPDRRFNDRLIVARNCVERCIGTLKTRFRCILNKERVLKYHPQKAGTIINACCVLHNMCMKANLPLDDELEMDDIEDIAIPVNHYVPMNNVFNAGRNQRANIINRYFR